MERPLCNHLKWCSSCWLTLFLLHLPVRLCTTVTLFVKASIVSSLSISSPKVSTQSESGLAKETHAESVNLTVRLLEQWTPKNSPAGRRKRCQSERGLVSQKRCHRVLQDEMESQDNDGIMMGQWWPEPHLE